MARDQIHYFYIFLSNFVITNFIIVIVIVAVVVHAVVAIVAVCYYRCPPFNAGILL